MKNLSRLSAALLTVGMLGAAACSSCSPAPEGASKPAATQQSYNCGANTHREGNQCVGDTGTSRARKSSTQVLKTTGNN